MNSTDPHPSAIPNVSTPLALPPPSAPFGYGLRRNQAVSVLLLTAVMFCTSKCGRDQPSPAKATPPALKLATNAGPEGDAVKTLARQYTKQPVTVVELPYQSLREQLVTTLGGHRSAFDVVMIDDPWFPQLAAGLADLPNIPDTLLADMVTNSLALCRYPYGTGKLRALPFVGNTQLLFYRPDLLTEAGAPAPPTTWAAVARIAADITSTSPVRLRRQVYGYAIRGRAGAPLVTDFLPIYWSLGGRLTDNAAAPTKQAVDLSKFSEALRLYRLLANASPPGATNYDWSEMTTDFIAGRVAMELNWPAAIPGIVARVSPGSWAIAAPPGLTAAGTSMIGNWLLAVPATSQQVPAAEAFVIWLLQSQELVANDLNPPTRKSIFARLATKPSAAYFMAIQQALENSTPRDRTPAWPQLEDAVSRAVSAFIAGDLTDVAAAQQVSTGIADALGTSRAR